MSPDNGSRASPIHEVPRAFFSLVTLFLEKIADALPKELLHTSCENVGGRIKFSADHARDSDNPEYLLAEYGDPKVGGVNVVGDGHGSHLSTEGVSGGISYIGHRGSGGVGGSDSHDSVPMGVSFGKSKMKLADMCTEQTRSVLMLRAVYFGVVGFSNTIIARSLQGEGSNGIVSFIKDLSKANHGFFQMFVLVNIFGFAASSGSLLIRGRGKLKSEVMFLICSIISILCMAFSFGVLVVCAFCSL